MLELGLVQTHRQTNARILENLHLIHELVGLRHSTTVRDQTHYVANYQRGIQHTSCFRFAIGKLVDTFACINLFHELIDYLDEIGGLIDFCVREVFASLFLLGARCEAERLIRQVTYHEVVRNENISAEGVHQTVDAPLDATVHLKRHQPRRDSNFEEE